MILVERGEVKVAAALVIMTTMDGHPAGVSLVEACRQTQGRL